MGLKVVQINVQHSKTDNVTVLLVEEEVNIALIQKPWERSTEVKGSLETTTISTINGFKDVMAFEVEATDEVRIIFASIYRAHDRPAPLLEGRRLVYGNTTKILLLESDANARHALWVSSENNDRDDLTVVALEGCKDETLLFGSCYMPHDEEAPQTELRKLVETAARKKHALVVGTDANAHHTVWGSADINDRGESLFTYILQSSLEIANRGEEPTYVGPTSRNVLDLILYTSRHVMVQEWEVLSRSSFSDHRHISFQGYTIKNTNNTPEIQVKHRA
ncbi:uncharacterized protein LOC129250321 [Anastrepha obliqua]|uniref:uncharacterized protein LOC129250321 n=1 Tax=Anastrepha obliqua TaxID=95512 RepID=UPI00240A80E2|nr:uncharacterized protein LOC129250321 [Anastrepha obliqua]